MKTILRRISLSVSRAHGSWLTLLLLLAVLVPSASLLWFMNRAAQNESLAVRKRLEDAYHAHLLSARDRLGNRWQSLAGELEAQADKLPAPVLFADLVRKGLADAVICFDAAGNLAYPDTTGALRLEAPPAGWEEAQAVESTNLPAAASAYARLAAQTTNHSVAASALQAQARCLVQAGQNEEAVSALSGWLTDERYGQATDGYGRLIAPNAALMAIELLKTSNPDQAHEWFERLRTRWLGYDSAMPASQRRFLMRELQTLFPQDAAFPALAAEDLAQRWLESGVTNHLEPVLQESPLTGVWQFASAHGRVLSLHLATNLIARMAATVGSQELPADVRVDFIAPGQEPVEASLSVLPAGPALPGWRLGLVLRDPRLLATATREQIMAYVWMGVLIVGTVVLLAFLALGMVRRQAALTQLRNDLVANVTHELKTPLSSMRLLVETLLNSPQIHEQTAREYLDLIAKENVRLSRLIDNFLTFSRIERNKYTFDFKPAPAAAIAESAAAAVRERFSAPGCRFEVEIAPDLPSVVADADAMVMALVNLLDNAYKYSGEAKQITFTAGIEDGNVRFAVEDNGIGLSPRDTKRIFKRFHQVNPHLSPTGGGCGLGLSIVQFVVTAHRGTVRVESEPGRGSTFIVCIPAGEPHAGPEAKP